MVKIQIDNSQQRMLSEVCSTALRLRAQHHTARYVSSDDENQLRSLRGTIGQKVDLEGDSREIKFFVAAVETLLRLNDDSRLRTSGARLLQTSDRELLKNWAQQAKIGAGVHFQA